MFEIKFCSRNERFDYLVNSNKHYLKLGENLKKFINWTAKDHCNLVTSLTLINIHYKLKWLDLFVTIYNLMESFVKPQKGMSKWIIQIF